MSRRWGCCCRVSRSGKRAERHEADAELGTRRQHLRLRVARPQRVLALNSGDRADGMRASDRARARLRQPEVAHLAGRDKLTDSASHLLDRDVRVDAVLIEEVDDIRAQPLQRRVRDLPDPLGPRVQAMVAAVSVEVETELRGDDDAIAQRTQRVPHELLVDKRPVDLGSVEERDPRRFDGIPDHADHVVPVTGVGAVTLGHAQGAGRGSVRADHPADVRKGLVGGGGPYGDIASARGIQGTERRLRPGVGALHARARGHASGLPQATRRIARTAYLPRSRRRTSRCGGGATR